MTKILRKKNSLNESVETDRDPLSLKIENIINNTLKNIDTLFELEADITYSLYDKNVAESSLRDIQARISGGKFDTATMRSDIHQSPNMLYHWLKRIHDLHKVQEAAAKE